MVEPKRITQRRSTAFTLIEIIVVVVILAIAALIAVPMMSSAADMQVRAAANRLAADIEYAKNMAITHQKPFTVEFDTTAATSGYTLSDSDGTRTHPVTLRPFVVTFPAERGLNRVRVISAAFDGSDTTSSDSVTFDYLGTPHSGTATGNTLNSGLVKLSDTAGGSELIVEVEPMTGYVTIQ